MLKQLIAITILCASSFIIATAYTGVNGCETGWTPYLDQKCFKALESVGTESEAELACTKLDPSSTLITIHTDQEEQFVSKYLATFAHISDYAWLGMKWSGSSFAWIDNSQVDYKSWGKDALLDGSLKCADISLNPNTLGNWTDDICTKRHLIGCQINQTSLYTLSKELFKLKTLVEAQNDEIKVLKSNTVPIGFIYTQLPNQTSPLEIWPNMKWADVSKDYAGLFFRADGGGALPFTQVQPANYSRISDMQMGIIEGVSYKDLSKMGSPIYEGSWSGDSGQPDWAVNSLYIFVTTGENRPRNTAMRLWKRLQ